MDLTGPRDPQCGEDVAPFALGALTPDEKRRFEQHLDACELCRTDLATLRPVVEALPETPEQVEPPADLRKRLMAVVEEEAAERRRTERRERASSSRPSWLPRPLPALAAACVLVVAGITAGVALNGGDATTYPAASAPPGVQASLRIDDEQGEIELEGLDAPARGRVLQVWLMREGSTTPEATDALFTPNRKGSASVVVPGDLDGVAQVLVSEEPAGGSSAPTTQPSLAFAVRSS